MEETNFRCLDCHRYCDIMQDGCTEAMNGGAWCDKCWYAEWEPWELEELRLEQALERGEVCPKCNRGCDYCLMLEPRSFR
jgi:hypothetical protein